MKPLIKVNRSIFKYFS